MRLYGGKLDIQQGISEWEVWDIGRGLLLHLEMGERKSRKMKMRQKKGGKNQR